MRRDVFQAIADPTRRAILCLIAVQAMTPGAIAGHFDNSRQSISKHLQILVECDLLRQEQEGREIHYHLNPDKMQELEDWLDQFKGLLKKRFSQLDEVLAQLKSEKKMKTSRMNFVVDKEKREINVEREFAAPPDMVWAAWTQAELLDRWWAPSPWKARTKSMDFTEGGYWLYAMVGPEGEEHWARVDYQTITAPESFSAYGSFCDADGVTDNEMPTNHWETRFKALSDSTRVDITLTFDSLEDLETIIEMGFREGFTAGLENLDTLLAEQLASREQS